MTDVPKMIRELADQGKLVETCWRAMRTSTLPKHAPASMVKALRHAYFMGAHNVFASMMILFDTDEGLTEIDTARINSIDNELQAFIAEVEKAALKPTEN
jgi:hypothetical protein